MKNYYILLVSIIFISGVLLSSLSVFAPLPSSFFVISIAILFGLLVLSMKREFFFLTVLFLLVFILGIVRYNTYNMLDKGHIKNHSAYSQGERLIQGKVVSDSVESAKRRKKTFILETHSIKSGAFWNRANGLVLVNLYGSDMPSFRYGDIIILEGLLRLPFSYKKMANFDYRQYLGDKRIYSVLNVKKGFFAKKVSEDRTITTKIMRFIYSMRNKFESHIETNLSSPQSSILTALLLGKRQKIPFWIKDSFAKTGTLHILAISGLHVGIIYFALKIILNILKLGRIPSIILSVLFLVCYAMLAGGRPSILRATTMFSILGLGEILKRKISVFNLVGLSCLMLLMVNPNQIFDIGFVLSYAAVLSIVCISPVFYRIFSVGEGLGPGGNFRIRLKLYLLKSISISIAVWIGLQPLIAYYFGLISPVVVLANLIVIPLTFIIMGTGILLLSLGFLSELLGAVFSQSAWFFLSVLINSARFLKNIPLSYFEIRPPHLASVMLYYVVLIIAVKVMTPRECNTPAV